MGRWYLRQIEEADAENDAEDGAIAALLAEHPKVRADRLGFSGEWQLRNLWRLVILCQTSYVSPNPTKFPPDLRHA